MVDSFILMMISSRRRITSVTLQNILNIEGM